MWVVGFVGLCMAQTSSKTAFQAQRDLESRLASLQADIAVNKRDVEALQVSQKEFGDKLDKANESLVELKTQVKFVLGVGGAILLLVGTSTWKLLTEKREQGQPLDPTNPGGLTAVALFAQIEELRSEIHTIKLSIPPRTETQKPKTFGQAAGQ